MTSSFAPACSQHPRSPRPPKVHLQFAAVLANPATEPGQVADFGHGIKPAPEDRAVGGLAKPRPWLIATLFLLLFPAPVQASEWVHDLQVQGSVPGLIQIDSLRINGNGASVLVSGSDYRDQRLATVDHAGAAVRWQAADRGSAQVRVRYADALGWVEWGDSGDGFLPAPDCNLVLRHRDGQIINQIKGLRPCARSLFDRFGAVISSFDDVFGLDLQGNQLWRIKPGDLGPALASPVRTPDGSVWVGTRGANLQLVRLAQLTGAELARTAPVPGGIRELRRSEDGGVQALVEHDTGSAKASVVAFGAQGEFLSELALIPAQALFGYGLASSTAGFAACWLQVAGDKQVLHAAVLDSQLRLRWSRALTPAANNSSCYITRSLAGRVAVTLLDGGSEVVLLRTDSRGAVTDRLEGADYFGLNRNLRFADDESLWLATFNNLSVFVGDQPGVSRQIPMTMQARLPRILGLAGLEDHSASLLLAEDFGQAAYTQQVAASGFGARSAPLPVTDGARIVAVADGWIAADGQRMVRVNHQGQVLWQRPYPNNQYFQLGCTRAGACAVADMQFPPVHVELFDGAGQSLARLPLAANEQPQQIFRDPYQDRLLLLTQDQTEDVLYEILGEQLLVRVRAPRPSTSSFSFGAPQVQIVQLHLGVFQAFDAAGLRWNLQLRNGHWFQRSQALEFFESPFKPRQVPVVGLAAIDANGQRRWSLDAGQFELSPDNSGVSIAGRVLSQTWLSTTTSQGLDRYQLRVVGRDGRIERQLDLPEASGSISALSTMTGEEAAIVAYPVRAADQPRLRVQRVQHGLFRDGLE